MSTSPQLGCTRCRSVPVRFEDLSIVAVRILWNSSHSSFELWRCESCGQSYLNQFHEILDWSGGEDDIWTRWMPLTPEEKMDLEAIAETSTDDPRRGRLWNLLAELMHRRARLVLDPTAKFSWSPKPWDASDLMPSDNSAMDLGRIVTTTASPSKSPPGPPRCRPGSR